jgi:hypothetical protein
MISSSSDFINLSESKTRRKKRVSVLTPPKEVRTHERLFEQLRNRIAHNYNEMSSDEIRLYEKMFVEEFLIKNPEFTGLVAISGYNWKVLVSLSIVPINSTFHNAELFHIAIKSHRRSAYDLQRARGKRNRHRLVESHDGHQLQLQSKYPIMIIFPRFNPSPNFSTNGFPFLNLYSYEFYSTIGGCYYCIANYSYSQSQFCSNSSISSCSSNVVSAPRKFLFREYRIPEPKGHYEPHKYGSDIMVNSLTEFINCPLNWTIPEKRNEIKTIRESVSKMEEDSNNMLGKMGSKAQHTANPAASPAKTRDNEAVIKCKPSCKAQTGTKKVAKAITISKISKDRQCNTEEKRSEEVEQLLLELKLTDDLQEQVDLANKQFKSFHLTLQMETDDDGDGTPITSNQSATGPKVEKVIA